MYHLRGAPSAISMAVMPHDQRSLCRIRERPYVSRWIYPFRQSESTIYRGPVGEIETKYQGCLNNISLLLFFITVL